MNRIFASLCVLVLFVSAVCRAQDWEPIFNGKDLTGWEGSAHWSAKDGIISGTITSETLIKTKTFLIWKAGTVDNFDLKCKFRMDGGNSGIQYRSVHLAKDKADPYIVMWIPGRHGRHCCLHRHPVRRTGSQHPRGGRRKG